jgi:hypothetical protein
VVQRKFAEVSEKRTAYILRVDVYEATKKKKERERERERERNTEDGVSSFGTSINFYRIT